MLYLKTRMYQYILYTKLFLKLSYLDYHLSMTTRDNKNSKIELTFFRKKRIYGFLKSCLIQHFKLLYTYLMIPEKLSLHNQKLNDSLI